jgi:hypothetical protein
MPYVLSNKHLDALLDFEPAELRKLPVDRRVELVLQHADTEAHKRDAFWSAVTAVVPLLVVLGFVRGSR